MMRVKPRVAVAATALVLLGLYAGLGFFAVPGWLATTAREYCRAHYGRELKLGAVHFNPLLFQLDLDGLRLPDADGGELLRWQHLEVEFQALGSLLRRGYVIGHIELDGPAIALALRPDGHWNIEDLLPPAPGASSPAAAPPRLWIDRLAVRGALASVSDQAAAVPRIARFTPVEFTLTGFSTITAGNRFALKATSPDLGQIEWAGSLGLNPVHSAGEFRLAAVNLARVAAWPPERLPLAVNAGTLALDGRYELTLRGTEPHLKAELSRLEVAALALRQPGAAADNVLVPRVVAEGLRYELPGGTLHLDALSVSGASVELGLGAALNVDPVTPVLHESLSPVDLALHDLSWPTGAPSRLEASVGIARHGRVALQGTVDLARRALDLDVNASELDLTGFSPLLARSTSLVLESASVGAKGRLHYAPASGARFEGAVGLGALRVADRVVKEDLLRWSRVDLSGVVVAQTPLSITVHEVVMREPYARLIIDADGSTNVADALAPPGQMRATVSPAAVNAVSPATNAQALRSDRSGKSDTSDRSGKAGKAGKAGPHAAPAPALPLEIATLRIIDGSMNYADYTLNPHFATGIVDLRGTIRGLSGRAGARAQVVLDGAVDRYAPVTIRGEVNYFAANSYTDLALSFHNLELTTFSPYSGKFAGYRIDRGKLSLDTHYHIVDRRLDARHHLVIDQLELGDRVESAEAVSLPVKLAVSLLKDRDGVIDLELPVTGSIDDPSFALGTIIWKVFVNLLEKAVAAPFALLGKLAGGGGSDALDFVDFAPGSAELDAANAARLGRLREALAARPNLKLDVPLVATAADAQALAAPSGAPAPPEQLAALAQARAETVQRALVEGSGVEPERLFVVATDPSQDPAPPTEPPTGAIERVRASLSLH
jgi:hypothetical protein